MFVYTGVKWSNQQDYHGVLWRVFLYLNPSKQDKITMVFEDKISSTITNSQLSTLGPSINDVTHFLRILTPLFPLSPILLNRLMEEHHLLAHPPSPLSGWRHLWMAPNIKPMHLNFKWYHLCHWKLLNFKLAKKEFF